MLGNLSSFGFLVRSLVFLELRSFLRGVSSLVQVSPNTSPFYHVSSENLFLLLRKPFEKDTEPGPCR